VDEKPTTTMQTAANEFKMTRRVHFSETDMVGVLHFSNYFRITEEVEHAFFRSLGLSVMTTINDLDIGWPRVAAAFEYYRPLRFEDEIDLRLTLLKLGDRSMHYDIEFAH